MSSYVTEFKASHAYTAKTVDYLLMTSRRLRWPEDKKTADVVPPVRVEAGRSYILTVDIALGIGTIKEKE